MIRHIVLYAFKDDLSESQIEQVFISIGKLSEVTEIKSYSWGKCNSRENLNKEFTHGFCMEFASEQARENYLTHPRHEELVANILLPLLADGAKSTIVFDYLIK